MTRDSLFLLPAYIPPETRWLVLAALVALLLVGVFAGHLALDWLEAVLADWRARRRTARRLRGMGR